MNLGSYTSLLSKKFILTRAESKRIIEHLIERISVDIARGKRVRFRGFGSFKKVRRPAHKFRNIDTGKIDVRPPKLDVDFSPGKKLLHRLARP